MARWTGLICIVAGCVPGPPADPAAVARALEEAQRGRPPVAALSLGVIRAELLDPGVTLVRFHPHDPEILRGLLFYERYCDGQAFEPDDPDLRKMWQWGQWSCRGVPLPADFFERPPMMHPTGHSYARKQLERGTTGEVHRAALHVTERGLLPNPRVEDRVWASLDATALSALGQRALLVVGREYVLFRARSGVRYDAHPRSDWDAGLPAQSMRLVRAGEGVSCVVPRGAWCWSNDHRRQSELRWYRNGAAVAVTLLALVSLWALFNRGRQRRRAMEQRAFVVRTLAHELRTPATTLLLSLEPLRAEAAVLSPRGERALWRLEQQAQRLRRLVEGSARYLSADASGERVTARAVPSLRDLVVSVIGDADVELDAPGDVALRTDPYWLELCVRNLVDNALAHGVPPVRVSLAQDEGAVTIRVEDAGDLSADVAPRITEPFVKSSSSAGLGLGMSIVERVAGMLGGRLDIARAPTAFTLRLPRRLP